MGNRVEYNALKKWRNSKIKYKITIQYRLICLKNVLFVSVNFHTFDFIKAERKICFSLYIVAAILFVNIVKEFLIK